MRNRCFAVMTMRFVDGKKNFRKGLEGTKGMGLRIFGASVWEIEQCKRQKGKWNTVARSRRKRWKSRATPRARLCKDPRPQSPGRIQHFSKDPIHFVQVLGGLPVYVLFS